MHGRPYLRVPVHEDAWAGQSDFPQRAVRRTVVPFHPAENNLDGACRLPLESVGMPSTSPCCCSLLSAAYGLKPPPCPLSLQVREGTRRWLLWRRLISLSARGGHWWPAGSGWKVGTVHGSADTAKFRFFFHPRTGTGQSKPRTREQYWMLTRRRAPQRRDKPARGRCCRCACTDYVAVVRTPSVANITITEMVDRPGNGNVRPTKERRRASALAALPPHASGHHVVLLGLLGLPQLR